MILLMSNISAKNTHWFNHKGTMNSPLQLSKNLRDQEVHRIICGPIFLPTI